MKLVRPFSLLATCLALVAPVFAQRIILTPPPPLPPGRVLAAPSPVAPGATTVEYDVNAPNFWFVWDQYPATVSSTMILPTHFLVCLRSLTDGPCTHGTATYNLLPGAVPSTVLRSSTGASIGYQYWYVPTVPSNKFDQVLEWEVGGCAAADDASCRFSPRTRFIVSTQDIQAVKLDGAPNSAQEFEIQGAARNVGSRVSGEFDLRVEGWEILFDKSTEQCVTDPNEETIKNETTFTVIDSKGVITPFSKLPRDPVTGKFVVSNVIAIYKPGGAYRSLDLMNRTLPPTFGLPQPLPRDWFGNVVMAAPNSSRPRGFAARITVDSAFELIESREENNTVAACLIVR